MSINWVMLHDDGQNFVKLPGEKQLYQSPPRTAFALTTPKTYPAHDPVSIHSDSGTLHLTNQRVVYLPTKPSPEFTSFSSPLLNLHDTHIAVPWFGPNAWQAIVQPVPGGNLPAANTGIELKLTFKEGGAPDFHSTFERIKERLQQAVEAARESGDLRQSQRAFMNGVNMDAVHLDQLPTYEASGQDRIAPNDEVPPGPPPGPPPSQQASVMTSTTVREALPAAAQEVFQPPPDAPPGYEETQQHSIQAAIDRRLSSA